MKIGATVLLFKICL